jgi:hypothetical protein
LLTLVISSLWTKPPKRGALETYNGSPHDMPAMKAETIDVDLRAFIGS